MRTILSVLPFTALTFLCWGVYGPVLHSGKNAMGQPKVVSSLRQLICVGIAYFVIAVVVPIVLLKTKGEKGHWSLGGLIWAMMGGACGALGALGIISALTNGGSPVYVMPLVFGCAPVVNTFVTMWMTKTFKQAPKVFFVGVGAVAIGAAGVMYFGTAGSSAGSAQKFWDLPLNQCVMILLSIGLTGLCWGSYGSVLHKGQAKLGDSRLRALLCVGLAYFLIAVLVPISLLNAGSWETTDWQWSGAWYSLAAGACGAFGALGIILSFNFGGKPVYVMPLVFGGAPIVNTVVTMTEKGTIADVPVMFLVSLVIVIAGAVTVLVFAPKPGKKKAAAAKDSKGSEPERREPPSQPAATEPQSAEPTPNHSSSTEGELQTKPEPESESVSDSDGKSKPPDAAEAVVEQEETGARRLNMTPHDAMRRIDTLLSHVWMVRTFLKHCEEAEEDDELRDVHRALYDYNLALGGPLDADDAEAYLKQATKKFSKLRRATELFLEIQPEVSGHTNFAMSARSLEAAVNEIGELLQRVKQQAI